MRKNTIKTKGKRALSMLLVALMVLSCWVWVEPASLEANAAEAKNKYLFAYFTDNSSAGQTIHLAVSEDGLHYTALRNNEPVVVPSKGTGAVRDPYLWYNEQDNYYYLIATDMDASNNQWWDNCNGFIMWRSKDLVHWYDETFINVYDMLQRFDEPVGIVHRAWAPQIMWDGSSYVVYFSIITDNVNYPAEQLSIVYFKTTDLMNLDAYYEYDGILYPGYDVNDAEIVQHPTNGKWYLFYKPENGNVKINMLVSDNATGPYTSPDASNSAGLDVFSTVNEALEGGNGFFDHNGDFVLYADAFGHGTSYFYVAKTDADGDFMNWTVYGESAHNINSLSPRHGSVVPITTEEYNRLLNNAYGITSSSFPANETLADHLIARYFTTADPTYNAVTGKQELELHGDAGVVGTDKLDTIGHYVKFNGNTCYGIDLEEIAGENFNADDGFTITFTALATSGENARIFEITDNPGQQNDGTSHYTHFSPAGGSGGAYVGNYNGPSGVAHRAQSASKQYNDGQVHEWIISYANGNTIVYCDGEMVIKMNRFDNAGTDDDAWYAAIRNATLYIGQSGWTQDPMLVGWISDFCIYDCSMSYYDVKNIQNEQDMEAGITGSTSISGGSFGSITPGGFEDDGTRNDSYKSYQSYQYSNLLYSPRMGYMPNSSGEDENPDSSKYSSYATVAGQTDNSVNVGIYYPEATVMYIDGVNDPLMPVLLGARINKNRHDPDMTTAYPSASSSSSADSSIFKLTRNWTGWTAYADFLYAYSNPDNETIGHNSSTRLAGDLDNSNAWIGNGQGDRDVYYYASLLTLNVDNVTFNSEGYQKYDPSWYWEDSSGASLNKNSTQHHTDGYQDGQIHYIWVIDLKGIVAAKNEIAANYNSIVTNPDYCPAIVESYKSVVAEIMKFNPSGYNYAGGVESAVSACSTQAQSLVNDYNNVLAELTAHNNGHKTLTIDGRDATCTAPGLSEGSYCEYCGEIFTAQEITDVVPHTFGAVYTVNGIQYVKCSVCGLEVKYAQYEVRYENLFDIEKWTYSASNQLVGSGTISADEKKGTITIVNNKTSGEIYTRAHYDGQNLVSSRDPGNYAIPVTGGRTYVVEATSLASSTSQGEVFVFQYDKDGKAFSSIPKVIAINPSETVSAEFTVDPNAAYIELRFDCNEAGKTITYKDIGVYETEERRTYFYPGDDKPLLNPTFKDGYAFDGWYTKSGAKIENTNQLSAPVNYVYSKWVKGVAIAFDANGGEGSFKWGYKKDGEVTLPSTDFTRTGYKLLGWSKSQNDTTATYGPGATVTVATLVGSEASATLYAVWEKNEYTISYILNNGNLQESAPAKYKYGEAVTIPSATKTGYTLTGWQVTSTDGNWSGTLTAGESISGKYGNVTLTAQWTPNTYKISFNSNGGTGSMDEQSVVYDTEAKLTSNSFTKTGNKFSGWNTKADGSGTSYTDGQTVKNLAESGTVTLYAQWVKASYTIKFDKNDSAATGEMNPVSVDTGVSYTLPANGFSKTGYTFAGWRETADGEVKYSDGASVKDLAEGGGEITLYAHWTAITYKVEFNAAGGTGGKTVNATYDVAVTAPTVSKTGYTFDGWVDSKGNKVDNLINLTTTQGETVILTAKWTANTYTVTFNANTGSGTAMPSQTLTYDKSAQLNANTYTKEGNSFAGWNTKADGTGTAYADKATVKNLAESGTVELYAQWATVTYTIKFVNGTETVKTVETKYGADAVTAPNVSKEGFDFDGWVDEKGNKVTNFKNLAKTEGAVVTLTAQWTITSAALEPDFVAIDFYRPVEIDPVANDKILLEELNGEKNYTLGLNGASQNFSVVNNKIKYNVTKNAGLTIPTETVDYTVTFGDTTLTSTITVTLASNVYYEEDMLEITPSDNLNWESKGSSRLSNVIVDTSAKDIYGYDKAYDVVEEFSDGTYLQANVTSANKKSDNASFEFEGMGFDLIGACGRNTGIQTVRIQKVVDGKYKLIKMYIVDTYYNGDLLRQAPILTFRGETGQYKVETTATYLNSATAIKNNTAYFSNTVNGNTVNNNAGKPTKALVNELKALGFEETENIEVIWMDDNSVFNGGTGSLNGSVFSGSAGKYFAEGDARETTGTPGLTNYIDGFRIYRNGGADYIASEQNSTYYNIVDGIGTRAFSGNFDVVTGGLDDVFGDEGFDYINYINSNEPKGEIYLAHNEAVAFTFSAEYIKDKTADIMLGMRVVEGTVSAKVTAKFTEKVDGETKVTTKETTPSVKSLTEMYYDVSGAVKVSGENGTVTILVANTGSGVLAVNNLKLVNGLLQSKGTNGGAMSGSNAAIGGTAPVPTPVVPDKAPGEAGNVEDIPETDINTDINAPEADTEVEDNTEDGSEGSIITMFPGIPAPVASFLELLFKLLTQLLSSFGF